MNSRFAEQRTTIKVALNDHLEVWLEAFLIDRKAQNFSPGTIIFYRKKLALLAVYCETQAVTHISQLTPDIVRRFILWLETKGHNPGGVNTYYRALRAFLRWYWVETDQEGNPPTAKVKAPRITLEPLTPIELPDVEKLVKVCGGDVLGLRDKAAFLVLLDTGARASEVAAMNIENLDLVSGAVLIRYGKGRKSRTVFLSQTSRRAVRAYLKSRQDINPALWLSDKGERLTYWGFHIMLKRRARQAKIEPPNLHGFRRAFALNMLRAGVDVFSLQELMGHADLQVLRRYLKQNTEDLRAAHAVGSPVDRLKIR